MSRNKNQLITVCDNCLMACCWQGIFYCHNYKTAGTVEKTRAELEKLGREHPSYWEERANETP